MYSAVIITVSDRSFSGVREDISGGVIEEILSKAGFAVIKKEIVPDEQVLIENALKKAADIDGASLIITTGGTGFSPRDVTPEATASVCHRMAPGIAEAMRYKSMEITPRAMLSRAVAGIRGKSLIINLPGSPKAVSENLNFIIDTIPHGLDVLCGNVSDCGSKV